MRFLAYLISMVALSVSGMVFLYERNDVLGGLFLFVFYIYSVAALFKMRRMEREGRE